jgi:hypothetical protein
MHHKPHRKLAALALLAALAAGPVAAQDFVFSWNPRTGDVWVDQTLGDINDYGYRYRESFIDELVRYYDAPRDYVTDLLVTQRWAPGDVYYACAIGQVVGRSCRYVAEDWSRHHGEGWGALAQRMGIKPGSAEFHRLKRGFVPTYDHWARPLRLDDALHQAFPDRARAAARDDAAGGPPHGKPSMPAAQRGTPPGHDKARGNPGKAHGNNGKGKGKGKGH